MFNYEFITFSCQWIHPIWILCRMSWKFIITESSWFFYYFLCVICFSYGWQRASCWWQSEEDTLGSTSRVWGLQLEAPERAATCQVLFLILTHWIFMSTLWGVSIISQFHQGWTEVLAQGYMVHVCSRAKTRARPTQLQSVFSSQTLDDLWNTFWVEISLLTCGDGRACTEPVSFISQLPRAEANIGNTWWFANSAYIHFALWRRLQHTLAVQLEVLGVLTACSSHSISLNSPQSYSTFPPENLWTGLSQLQVKGQGFHLIRRQEDRGENDSQW